MAAEAWIRTIRRGAIRAGLEGVGRAWLLSLGLLLMQSLVAAERWPLAVTIDDVPLSGAACDPALVDSVNSRLLAQLAAAEVPATAFVVTHGGCNSKDDSLALTQARRWQVAGHTLGNHSATHRDYNALSAADYLADLDRAEQALQPLWASQPVRWFRPPLLHTGPDATRRQALQDWLNQHGQRMGVVTIDNQEWLYAAAWAQAEANGDRALQAAILSAYRQHLQAAVSAARQWSRAGFDRDIAQVLLLHANTLNAAHLGTVLADLRASGAEFVTLEQASTDPAHASPDRYVGPRGLSWLLRWLPEAQTAVVAEPREADWLARLSGADAKAARAQAIDQALDAANQAFSNAWMAGDHAALAAAYGADGVLHPPAGGVLVGRAAIAEFWQRSLRPNNDAHHRLQTTLRQVHGDQVLELGRWHVERPDEQGQAATSSGCYSLWWQVDEDEQWRIAFDTWTDVRPASWACVPRGTD